MKSSGMAGEFFRGRRAFREITLQPLFDDHVLAVDESLRSQLIESCDADRRTCRLRPCGSAARRQLRFGAPVSLLRIAAGCPPAEQHAARRRLRDRHRRLPRRVLRFGHGSSAHASPAAHEQAAPCRHRRATTVTRQRQRRDAGSAVRSGDVVILVEQVPRGGGASRTRVRHRPAAARTPAADLRAPRAWRMRDRPACG